jgi:hypothetical protein
MLGKFAGGASTPLVLRLAEEEFSRGCVHR